MRLGIIGSQATISAVTRAVSKHLGDVYPVPRPVDYGYQALAAATQLQKEGLADAILFTHPLDFHHTRTNLTPILPWRFIPHSQAAIMVALLTSMSAHLVRPRGISMDWEDATLFREVLAQVGLGETTLSQPTPSVLNAQDIQPLVRFHRDAHQSGQVSLCLTSREPVQRALVARNIPCHLLLPGAEAVIEQVYRLRVMGLAHSRQQGKLAVIAVRFEYFFDDIEHFTAREWEKLKYHNAFREHLHMTAQQMQAAVFASGTDYFYMVTTQEQLNLNFLQNQAYLELLQFGRHAPERLIWAGIGVGDSVLEARSRATMALNQSTADAQGHFHLVTDESQPANPLAQPEPGVPPSPPILPIQGARLAKLRQILDTYGTTLDAETLARHLGVTTRSANRIITQLEDAGLAHLVGTRTTGKGRPARILQIHLPPEEGSRR